MDYRERLKDCITISGYLTRFCRKLAPPLADLALFLSLSSLQPGGLLWYDTY
jgi:hypothetical protein